MRKLFLLTVWLCAMVFVVVAGGARPAQAQNSVSYVSNTGSDAYACFTPAAACADFATALANTNAGGEIDCVNAGNYGGNFTIGITVTIDCAGAVGFSPGKIIISGDGIVVRLRNLSINGGGADQQGVEVDNAAALYVEHCVITNNAFDGIYFAPTAGASQLFVSDSIISQNGGGSIEGIRNGGTLGNAGIDINPQGSGGTVATIERSRIEGNITGIQAGTSGGSTLVTVSGSIVSGNQNNNIQAAAERACGFSSTRRKSSEAPTA